MDISGSGKKKANELQILDGKITTKKKIRIYTDDSVKIGGLK